MVTRVEALSNNLSVTGSETPHSSFDKFIQAIRMIHLINKLSARLLNSVPTQTPTLTILSNQQLLGLAQASINYRNRICDDTIFKLVNWMANLPNRVFRSNSIIEKSIIIYENAMQIVGERRYSPRA